jgi:hypothetical protein
MLSVGEPARKAHSVIASLGVIVGTEGGVGFVRTGFEEDKGDLEEVDDGEGGTDEEEGRGVLGIVSASAIHGRFRNVGEEGSEEGSGEETTRPDFWLR